MKPSYLVKANKLKISKMASAIVKKTELFSKKNDMDLTTNYKVIHAHNLSEALRSSILTNDF